MGKKLGKSLTRQTREKPVFRIFDDDKRSESF